MVIRARSPVRVIIAEHGEADDGELVTVKQAIMVDKHPLGKVGIGLRLNFDMNQHPDFRAVFALHLYQLIRQTFAQFGITHNLL